MQIQTLNVQAVDAMATSLSLLPIADKNKESRFEVPNAKPLLGDIDIHFVHFKSQYVSTLTRFLFIPQLYVTSGTDALMPDLTFWIDINLIVKCIN